MNKVHSVAENFKVYKGSYVGLDRMDKIYPISMRKKYIDTTLSKFTGEYCHMDFEFNSDDMKEFYGIVIEVLDRKGKVLTF